MFQFPSNGKLHSNEENGTITAWERWFQFPSNGKLHSNKGRHPREMKSGWMFQFPSNGKLHSNQQEAHRKGGVLCVSIPFKRETAFKLSITCSNQALIGCSFNSLQTGNCIQTKKMEPSPRGSAGFNSLQTGNCIQTRENADISPERLKFQFPSNGKLHSNF